MSKFWKETCIFLFLVKLISRLQDLWQDHKKRWRSVSEKWEVGVGGGGARNLGHCHGWWKLTHSAASSVLLPPLENFLHLLPHLLICTPQFIVMVDAMFFRFPLFSSSSFLKLLHWIWGNHVPYLIIIQFVSSPTRLCELRSPPQSIGCFDWAVIERTMAATKYSLLFAFKRPNITFHHISWFWNYIYLQHNAYLKSHWVSPTAKLPGTWFTTYSTTLFCIVLF